MTNKIKICQSQPTVSFTYIFLFAGTCCSLYHYYVIYQQMKAVTYIPNKLSVHMSPKSRTKIKLQYQVHFSDTWCIVGKSSQVIYTFLSDCSLDKTCGHLSGMLINCAMISHRIRSSHVTPTMKCQKITSAKVSIEF